MLKNLKPVLSSLEQLQSLSKPSVSFEFFPPKTDEMEARLWETVEALEPFQPEFVSVTYGAGGSTREKTHATVKRIKETTSLKPSAHLTCVAATKEEINEVAQNYLDIGVNRIVALRGDPPDGKSKYTPHPGGYAYTVELVQGLLELGDFDISVACFPEVHPEAESPEADLHYLKDKLDAGANRAISQYFFDTDTFLRFYEKARAVGIDAPIIPGIVVISNFKQLVNFSARCGATVPKWVYNLLDGMDDHPRQRDIISAVIASEQCRILREAGIEQFHFYTLNRPIITSSICDILGLSRK